MDTITDSAPRYRMTRRRRQVIAYLQSLAGEPVTLGRVVRDCGFYDTSAARRVVNVVCRIGGESLLYTAQGSK